MLPCDTLLMRTRGMLNRNMNDPSEASPFVADTIVRVNVPGLHSYPTVQVAAFLMDHFVSAPIARIENCCSTC